MRAGKGNLGGGESSCGSRGSGERNSRGKIAAVEGKREPWNYNQLWKVVGGVNPGENKQLWSGEREPWRE